jgi:alkylation response protein AidB-like acyl-CoA dehydrogenase
VVFDLPEELREIQRIVRELCLAEVAPRARAWDESGEFPWEVVRRLGPLGLLGIAVPEAYGGAGLGALALAVVVEELARFDGSLALTVASHNGLGAGHVLHSGTEAQRRRWLPALARGETLAAWALAEPGSGRDVSALRTTAVRRGEGWVLNGSKTFVAQGTVAGIFVVLARTDPERPHDGVTAFLLEKGTKGFTQGAIRGRLGMRSSDRAELHLDDVEVPDDQRLGEVSAALPDTLRSLDRGRIGLGAVAVGLARGALEESRAYAKDRRAFGRPIADFQAIQFMLADMATELAAARLLVHRAAALCDAGAPCAREAAMGKLYAGGAALRATSKAVQIHGGYGYTTDFPVERHYRDAKLTEIDEETGEVQRSVISQEILR